jgi:transposase InsO family protein
MGHLQSGAPWDTLAIDYLGPLPMTENGNKYIMILTDHFTKYVEVLAVPNQLAKECALRIANEFVSRWGTPLKIHTDQGSTFESNVFKELCSLFQVKKSRTSPRNPKCNGQTKRYNKTLLKIIKAYLIDQTEWDLFLGCIAGAYRSSPNETTKLTRT